MENIWLYDIEVFKEDWLVIFHPLDGGDHLVIHNDCDFVREFINSIDPVLVGYNVKHYDQHILRCIYNKAPNNIVKICNDYIIGGNQGWTFEWFKNKDKLPDFQIDLMDDIPVPLRLKEIEANIGMSIVESKIPFDIDRELTAKELEEITRYCHHDVDATVKLFELRKDYLASKISVGALKDISWVESASLTNAKLTARYLGARLVERSDEYEYEFPENLQVRNATVLGFFSEIDYDKRLETNLAGTPHIIAWGGLHGALETYKETATHDRLISSFDVASYYPSLMIVNGYMSRNVADSEEYRRVYETRLAAKKSGDKATADALKLVLNTTYGAMKNQYNDLFDPKMANAVCISGQLYLIDLIEKLEDNVEELTLVQSNTDGIIVSYPISARQDVMDCISGWERRTGFFMEETPIQKIVQKDVNNYVLVDGDGKLKVKGGYVSNFDGGSWRNRSLVIVDRAVADFFAKGKPVDETVRECDDVWQFQMIAKTGRTYDKTVYVWEGKDIEVQSTNRIFATLLPMAGSIYKVKTAENGRDKVANAPEQCIIDNSDCPRPIKLDMQFYINLANKRVKDYLGIVEPKLKKERKKKMATTRKTQTQDQPQNIPAEGLSAKLFKLRTIMASFKWEKDGKNRHQGYTYITEAQYKHNFQQALIDAGLDFRLEAESYQFIPAVSDKMHMIIATYIARIIDPDTGDEAVYKVFGSGADNGDKAIYKAETGAIKFFLAGNFLVAENNDPESDEEEIVKEKPKFKTPEAKAEIKAKLQNQDAPATVEQLEIIAEGIAQLSDKDLIEGFEAMLTDTLTKKDAEEIIEAIGEVLAA